jgi:hypothetical protein
MTWQLAGVRHAPTSHAVPHHTQAHITRMRRQRYEYKNLLGLFEIDVWTELLHRKNQKKETYQIHELANWIWRLFSDDGRRPKPMRGINGKIIKTFFWLCMTNLKKYMLISASSPFTMAKAWYIHRLTIFTKARPIPNYMEIP